MSAERAHTRVRPSASLSDQLVMHLAGDIVAGRLPADTTLPPESSLAAEFGISKVVVRESTKLLASLGLIRIQHGKRSRVLPETEWNTLSPEVQEAFRQEDRGEALTHQLYEVRAVLETAAAAWAAERSSESDLQRLAQLGQQMHLIASTSRDLGEFLETDHTFHDLVANMTGNIALRRMLKDIHSYLSNNWQDPSVTQEELELLASQHVRIATAVGNRDVGQARRTMQSHLDWAERADTRRVVSKARDKDLREGRQPLSQSSESSRR